MNPEESPASGEQRELYEAIRAAFAPLVREGWRLEKLPTKEITFPEVRFELQAPTDARLLLEAFFDQGESFDRQVFWWVLNPSNLRDHEGLESVSSVITGRHSETFLPGYDEATGEFRSMTVPEQGRAVAKLIRDYSAQLLEACSSARWNETVRAAGEKSRDESSSEAARMARMRKPSRNEDALIPALLGGVFIGFAVLLLLTVLLLRGVIAYGPWTALLLLLSVLAYVLLVAKFIHLSRDPFDRRPRLGDRQQARLALSRVGWRPGRGIGKLLRELESGLPSYRLSSAASKALLQFGGLEWSSEEPGRDQGRVSFHLTPTAIDAEGEDRPLLLGLEKLARSPVFPLGTAFKGEGILAIAENGRVYCIERVDQSVLFVGSNIQEAIDNMVLGARIRKVSELRR
jgi:hypothetical protein